MTIRFRLSERATVRFAIQRPRPGVRVRVKGKTRCRHARGPRRGRRRCTNYRTVARIVRRSRRPGANRIRFSGRIGRRALRRGRYRLIAVAVDIGGKRSRPRRTSFRALAGPERAG